MAAPDGVDLDVLLAEWAHALMVWRRLLRLWLAVWHRMTPLSLDQCAQDDSMPMEPPARQLQRAAVRERPGVR